MAVAPDISPYDDITSDELFDSFMDVVSGVEQEGFNGNDESNEQSDHYENPYEDIGAINNSLSDNTHSSTVCVEKSPVEEKLSNSLRTNDSRHLPLLVKLNAEPIYELCGAKSNPYDGGPLISDLDKPYIDSDNTENAYTDIYSVISPVPKVPSRTCETERNKCKNNTRQDEKISNSISSDIVCDLSDVTSYSSLYASVSMETRTKPIVNDEYAVVNREHKSIKLNYDNIDDDRIRTEALLLPDTSTNNNRTEIMSGSTDDYETVSEAKSIGTGTDCPGKPPTDLYAVVNKEGSCSRDDLEQLHKKIHFLRQKSLSSPNIELSLSVRPTNLNINTVQNNNTSTKSNNPNTTTDNCIGNDNNNNNNISDNNINQSKDCIDNRMSRKATESEYELVSELKRCDTNSSASSNEYSNIDDIRNYHTDPSSPSSPEIMFNAEQIAYGFRKSQLVNGSAISQPSIKSQPTKDKRNFFGFSKWKSTDESSKSTYQNVSADDLGKDSKVISPPSRRSSSIPVLSSGYLFKQGGTGFTPKNWRLRWFELKKDNCLYYYKSEQDHIPNGAVILVKYEVIRAVEVNKRFAFKLWKAGARTYYFAANSEDEMNKWMTHISDATKQAISDHVSIPDCSLKNVSIPAASISDPDHYGYISKQGSTHKTWKKRYCVLKYGCLFYYEDMNDKVAIGVFKLHKYTVNTSDHIRYGFEATPPARKMRTYYFYTNSETDTKRWVDAMKRSIANFQ